MSTSIIEYGVTSAGLAELRERLLVPFDATTREGYEHARKGIAECRGLRGDIEAKRKELKADALDYGRRVDHIAKHLTAEVESIEGQLRAAKDAVDKAKEREKKAAEEAAKQRVIAERLAAEQQAIDAERARIAQEKAVKEAAERAAREERERIERERLAAEQAEAERVAQLPDRERLREWIDRVAAVVSETVEMSTDWGKERRSTMTSILQAAIVEVRSDV